MQTSRSGESQANGEFRPWVSNLILAGYGLVALWMAYYFLLSRGYIIQFVVALFVGCLFVRWQWKQFVRRSHGQRVERSAVASLRKALSRIDGSSMDASVMLPNGGDADALVVLNGVRYNIEIKSFEEPRRVTSAHVKQAQQAASVLLSIPVIWLPTSKRNQARDLKDVRVVSGDVKALIKALEGLA